MHRHSSCEHEESFRLENIVIAVRSGFFFVHYFKGSRYLNSSEHEKMLGEPGMVHFSNDADLLQFHFGFLNMHGRHTIGAGAN